MTREQELEQALAAMTRERDDALEKNDSLQWDIYRAGEHLAAEREARQEAEDQWHYWRETAKSYDCAIEDQRELKAERDRALEALVQMGEDQGWKARAEAAERDLAAEREAHITALDALRADHAAAEACMVKDRDAAEARAEAAEARVRELEAKASSPGP